MRFPSILHLRKEPTHPSTYFKRLKYGTKFYSCAIKVALSQLEHNQADYTFLLLSNTKAILSFVLTDIYFSI